MIMMVINKRKLKKIILFIAVILFIIGGIIYTLKNRSTESIELLDMAGGQNLYTMGTNTYSGYVALTCNVDLGWEDEYIDSILKTLDRENVKITFAVTGKWAEKNKEKLLQMKTKGHEIANHGYKHLDYDKLSYEENLEQIKTSKKIIEDITGVEGRFFQAPSGAFSNATIKAANDLGYICYKWDIDTIDWMYKDKPLEIINRIQKKDIKSSSIILMHPTKATTICLSDIIAIVRKNGYKPGTLNDIFL